MLLTQTLFGFLNRVFSRDPQQFLAFTISYNGSDGVTWNISNGILTTLSLSSGVVNLSVDLSQNVGGHPMTIGNLISYISGQTGYDVRNGVGQPNRALAALVLLDGSGNTALPNGGNFYGYTSLLYSCMEAVSVELSTAETAIVAMPAQLNIQNADGSPGAQDYWLDQLGLYFDVPRNDGEADGAYGPRMMSTVLRAPGNNVAMEIAISDYTGNPTARVTDVVTYGSNAFVYDGTFKFDGSQGFNGGTLALQYNLFDVRYAYDFSAGGTPATVQAAIVALVNSLRDAGMHPRHIYLSYANLTDETGDELMTEDGNFLFILE